MRTQTTIKGIEEKTSKNGRKYKSYKTDLGNLTCFEDAVIAELDKNFNQIVEIEYEERNGFKNITAFYAGLSGLTPTPIQPVLEQKKINDSLPLTERDFRINIKQSSKGFAYFEVTAKADNISDLEDCLNAVLDIAKKSVEELNQNFSSSNSLE